MVNLVFDILRIIRRKKRFLFFICIFLFIVVYYIFFSDARLSSRHRDGEEKPYLFQPTVSATNKTSVFLLVVVMTGPTNFDRRKVFRQTWLKSKLGASDVQHYFVVGTKGLDTAVLQQIHEEQLAYKDLIVLDELADAYEKLTEKLGLTFIYLNKEFSFKYAFKVDDDTYALLDKIVYELKNNASLLQADTLYWGYFNGKANVKKSGPWKETEWKLCDYYLPHARGGGYIVSKNIVDYVAFNYPMFKEYKSEDISLGAWIAPLKVTRIHDVRFNTEYKSRGCKNVYIVTHKQSIDDIKRLHANLQDFGKLCKKETTVMYGYNYNWDVPPSECCKRTQGIP